MATLHRAVLLFAAAFLLLLAPAPALAGRLHPERRWWPTFGQSGSSKPTYTTKPTGWKPTITLKSTGDSVSLPTTWSLNHTRTRTIRTGKGSSLTLPTSGGWPTGWPTFPTHGGGSTLTTKTRSGPVVTITTSAPSSYPTATATEPASSSLAARGTTTTALYRLSCLATGTRDLICGGASRPLTLCSDMCWCDEDGEMECIDDVPGQVCDGDELENVCPIVASCTCTLV